MDDIQLPEDEHFCCSVFVLAGITDKSLLQALDTAVGMNQIGDNGIAVPYYVDVNVSTKVVKIIRSYASIANKMV